MQNAFHTRFRKRKARIFLLMPLAVFLWYIGWSLCWIGSQGKTTKPKLKMSIQKELIIYVPTPEQEYTISSEQNCTLYCTKMIKKDQKAKVSLYFQIMLEKHGI